MITFCGLTSRCTTPRPCACSSAPQSARPIRSTSRSRQQALGAELVDRAAVDELGHQVARPRVLAGVEDRDDPGMVEPAGGQRLALRRASGRRAGPDGITLTATARCEALVGRRVDRPEPARAEPVGRAGSGRGRVGARPRRELVRGLHQARVRRATRRSLRSPCHPETARPATKTASRLQDSLRRPRTCPSSTRTTSPHAPRRAPRTSARAAPRRGRVAGGGPVRCPDRAGPADGGRHRRRRDLLSCSSLVRACNNTRHDNALQASTTARSPGIATASRQTGTVLQARSTPRRDSRRTSSTRRSSAARATADNDAQAGAGPQRPRATWSPPSSRC